MTVGAQEIRWQGMLLFSEVPLPVATLVAPMFNCQPYNREQFFVNLTAVGGEAG